MHPSEFAHEQEALDLLRRQLPDTPPFRAWSNFEFIAEDGSINEVDALVVSTDRVYLIEIKSWRGQIGGDQNTWTVTPAGRRRRYEENPLLLANRKAKKFKSLLARQPAFKKMPVPFIKACVFLSSPQCEILLDEIAGLRVYLRPDADRKGQFSIVDLIRGRATEAEGRPRLGRDIERAFSRGMEQIGFRKRTGEAAHAGDYRLTRLIHENDRYQDWEAQHARIEDDRKRVRIFLHGQQTAEADKRERKDIAAREYELLREVRHDHIVAPLQLTESDIGPALIYDYEPDAQRLAHLLDSAGEMLTLDQRLDLMRQVAETLAYAHQRGVHHRALSPWTIEVVRRADGGLFAGLRDWQSGASGSQASTEVRMTLDVGERAGVIDAPQAAAYMAPEVASGYGYDPIGIDIFALGALGYAIFSGGHPAIDREQMAEKLGHGSGLLISEVLDGTPDALQELIQLATDPDPEDRPADAREFLELLDQVEDALTSPDIDTGVSVADAGKGDRLNQGLTGRFEVNARLGSGSTRYALAVARDDGRSGVLKVAKEPALNERLRQEAAALQELRHPNIVMFLDAEEIDGCAAIFMERAGDDTLGQRLRRYGVLSLDLLERFGDELLSALVYLERVGINHRDIKPENIGIGLDRKKTLTLKLFDFSLSRAPSDNIRAGTRPYLEPFLSQRRPPRWDLHAERFAAGMTLHELATGTLATWGSAGQDPATTSDEASLEVEALDPSIRDTLAAFFRRALARNHRKRFDNADDMHLAWRGVFHDIDRASHPTRHDPTTHDDTDDEATTIDLSVIPDISRATELASLDLSPRLVNAAERIGAHTAGELLDLPRIRMYRNRGIGQKLTRRLRDLRQQLAKRLDSPPTADASSDSPDHDSIDRLVARLEGIEVGHAEAAIISVWLGLDDYSHSLDYRLPNADEVSRARETSRDAVQKAVDKAIDKWSKNRWMTALRDEAADFVQQRGGIVTVPELAARLLAQHGSTAVGDERRRQALSVVQALLQAEAQRESARYVLSRGHAPLLVVATGGPGQTFGASVAERVEYTKDLAEQAAQLAHQEPLPTERRIHDALAAIAAPAGDPPLAPDRRLRLAAAAAPGVALSGRLELYPEGMSAQRALRLGGNSLLGARRLSVEQLQRRIQSRFAEAEPLPNRPDLDRLLQQAEFPLEWRESGEGLPAGYAMPVPGSGLTRTTSTLRRRTTARGADSEDARTEQIHRFEETVQRAIAAGRVLIVTCPLRHIEQAAERLASALALEKLSLDRLLIDNLRARAAQVGADWAVVQQADAAAQDSADWRRLATLVRRTLPDLRGQLRDDSRALLVQHIGLLVRYEQIGLIQQLRDDARAAATPARLLLVPGDDTRAPMLDGAALPVVTPADWAFVPRAWLEDRHRAAPAGPRVDHA